MTLLQHLALLLTFSLPEPDHMQLEIKVGFMNRTVNWTRVAEEDMVPQK